MAKKSYSEQLLERFKKFGINNNGNTDLKHYGKQWSCFEDFISEHADAFKIIVSLHGTNIEFRISVADNLLIAEDLLEKYVAEIKTHISTKIRECIKVFPEGYFSFNSTQTNLVKNQKSDEFSRTESGCSISLSEFQANNLIKTARKFLDSGTKNTPKLNTLIAGRWVNEQRRMLRVSGARSSAVALTALAKFAGYKNWQDMLNGVDDQKSDLLQTEETPTIIEQPKIEVPMSTKNDAHSLLVDVLQKKGRSAGRTIYKVLCPQSHLAGYASLPNGEHDVIVAIPCSECNEIIAIGEPLVSIGEVGPPPAIEQKAQPEKVKPVPEKKQKPQESPTGKTMERARQIKEERRLALMLEQENSVAETWKNYKAKKTQDSIATLGSRHPYEKKVEVPSETLLLAFWVAWDQFGDSFVSKVAKIWNWPEQLLRGRVETTLSWLSDALLLQMPFMAKATKSPEKWTKKLEALRAKAEQTPKAKEATHVPEISGPAVRIVERPEADWRNLNKIHGKVAGQK